MQYCFTQGAPVSEREALAEAAELGFEAFAFDVAFDEDETVHWHEFDSVSWVISGTGAGDSSTRPHPHR